LMKWGRFEALDELRLVQKWLVKVKVKPLG